MLADTSVAIANRVSGSKLSSIIFLLVSIQAAAIQFKKRMASFSER
jgi:hypothetical protein